MSSLRAAAPLHCRDGLPTLRLQSRRERADQPASRHRQVMAVAACTGHRGPFSVGSFRRVRLLHELTPIMENAHACLNRSPTRVRNSVCAPPRVAGIAVAPGCGLNLAIARPTIVFSRSFRGRCSSPGGGGGTMRGIGVGQVEGLRGSSSVIASDRSGAKWSRSIRGARLYFLHRVRTTAP